MEAGRHWTWTYHAAVRGKEITILPDVINQHIEITPGVAGGKPRIAGHRITVQNIVIWHDRMGMSADEIATTWGLTLADVYAALTYYFDHREEIDRSMRESEEFIEEMRKRSRSKLKEKLARGRG